MKRGAPTTAPSAMVGFSGWSWPCGWAGRCIVIDQPVRRSLLSRRRLAAKETVGEERDGAARVELSKARGRGAAAAPRDRRETRKRYPATPYRAEDRGCRRRERTHDARERDQAAPASTKVRRDELDQRCPARRLSRPTAKRTAAGRGGFGRTSPRDEPKGCRAGERTP